MATYYFGLNVNRSLAEIADKPASLRNINLDIRDLNKIRGLTSQGVTKTDLQTLSGINFDAEKVTNSLLVDSSVYESLTSNVFDKYSYINTNIDVFGALAASSFKYKYVDFNEANTLLAVKSADVSTSRVSSWSTLETPINSETPIFYGGNVTVDGPIELSKLSLSTTILKREFDSEFPTHRILATIGGQNMYLYAMKGIPLVFNGFFRTATLSARISRISGINASWVVRNTVQPSSAANTIYRNVGDTQGRSTISFDNSFATNRTVEFYYPPSNILELNLSRLNMLEFPKVILPALTSLNLSYNDLREFPNLSQFTQLSVLDLSFNNLTRAAASNLRSLTPTVVSRLPTGLTSLTLGNAFGGNITGNLATLPLTTLVLDCATISDRRYSGVTPTVNSSTIQVYSMNINRFNTISSSVLSSNVKIFRISTNLLTQSNISFTSPDLEELTIVDNVGSINLVNVAGKDKLKFYILTQLRFGTGNDIQTIFNGCTALQRIFMRNTNVAGRFPQLIGCSSLREIDLITTNVQGFDAGIAFSNTTFDSCRSSLQTMYVSSPNMSGTIESGTFKGMYNLRNLMITSNRNTGVSGILTNDMFSDCNLLSYAWFNDNRFTGSVPIFNNSPNIFYVYGAGNQFTGSVPNINKPSLRYLYLFNNSLNQFSSLQSTGLIVLHLSNNQLTNIPDLSNLTSLQELYLNNNLLASYTPGSFTNMTAIRILNLNNNLLTQGLIDQILKDLNDNYDLLPRRNVSVNLRGPNNAAPSNSREIRDIILKLNSSGWNVVTN